MTLDCTTCTATYGSGWRIAGKVPTTEPRRTVASGEGDRARLLRCGVAHGRTRGGICAPRTAGGALPTGEPAMPDSGSPGNSLHESGLPRLGGRQGATSLPGPLGPAGLTRATDSSRLTLRPTAAAPRSHSGRSDRSPGTAGNPPAYSPPSPHPSTNFPVPSVLRSPRRRMATSGNPG